ncbi:MAG: glucosyltransferase domain-containing protein [Akkermansia sp.]|nr:glucosyltransferase domain-containing protein [Akkermansia sp.]
MTGNEKSMVKDAVLFTGSFFLFIYIHLPLALRFGYDADEILDYTGSQMAQDVYLSCGRWGLVLWSWLVGDGIKPWSGGITAGVILCAALILQTKILFAPQTQSYYKAIYCAIYLACCQFAYTMSYSMQVEGFALAILFATLACFVLFATQSISYIRILSSIGLLFVALSFYQTSGLLFFTLFLCCMVQIANKTMFFKHLAILGGTCLGAIILFALSKAAILTFVQPCEEAMLFAKHHEQWTLSEGILHTKTAPIHLIINRFMQAVSCNKYLQICTFVSLLMWGYRMMRQRNFLKLCLMLAAIVIPYAATLFMYTEQRMLMFLPLFCAFCVTTVASRFAPAKHYRWMIPILAIICIFAAHKVSHMSLTERTKHDFNLMERYAQYYNAQKLMLDSGLNEQTGKIIVFERGWNRYAPDFYHSYPFKNFHLGTYKDYETYQHILNNMPCWPASGSIVRDENVILIKGQSRW